MANDVFFFLLHVVISLKYYTCSFYISVEITLVFTRFISCTYLQYKLFDFPNILSMSSVHDEKEFEDTKGR